MRVPEFIEDQIYFWANIRDTEEPAFFAVMMENPYRGLILKVPIGTREAYLVEMNLLSPEPLPHRLSRDDGPWSPLASSEVKSLSELGAGIVAGRFDVSYGGVANLLFDSVLAAYPDVATLGEGLDGIPSF